jgi:AcrR family transcriptional regulator
VSSTIAPSVIAYAPRVPRWKPDAQQRLVAAALELFDEHGYEGTTVAEIAERAGLTKRTFFRYFSDKREVLFSGTEQLQELMVGAIASAPERLAPLDVVALALEACAAMFDERRSFVGQRSRVIAANPELQERELIKMAGLARLCADALRERGVGDPTAGLAAEAGIAVFRVGFERWVANLDGPGLDVVMREGLAELRAVAA